MAADEEGMSDHRRLETPGGPQAIEACEYSPFFGAQPSLDDSHNDALALIGRWRGNRAELKDLRSCAQLGIYLVDALRKTGETGRATILLLAVLRIGKNTGLFRPYRELDPDTLLCELLKRPTEDPRAISCVFPLIVGSPCTSTSELAPIAVDRQCAVKALTARERTVLQSICMGHSNKRIAATLKIAPETVKSHTKHIFDKLGTRSRAHSVAYAAKLGLIA